MSEEIVLNYFECKDCGYLHITGISCCPKCGSFHLEKKASDGKGYVYTFTIPAKALTGNNKDRYPYAITVVETTEGVRLSTIVQNIQEDKIKIGDKVKLVEKVEGMGYIFSMMP